jgi:transposase
MARRPGSREETERKRKRAIEIVFKEKRSQVAAAKEVGVTPRAVSGWISVYRKIGVKGLKTTKATGRPNKLSATDKKTLSKILIKGAKFAGFSNDLWTSKRILKVIKDRFGVEYHFNHIPKLLKSLGWSVQRPQREAIEKDPKAIRKWIKTEWVRIKKKPAEKKPL